MRNGRDTEPREEPRFAEGRTDFGWPDVSLLVLWTARKARHGADYALRSNPGVPGVSQEHCAGKHSVCGIGEKEPRFEHRHVAPSPTLNWRARRRWLVMSVAKKSVSAKADHKAATA
jgi:hypothetical protein